MPATVTLVLVNWNGKHLLQQFMPTLQPAGWPQLQLCMVDNASTDGSAAWLRTHYPDARLLQPAQNLGFAHGNNLAVEQIESTYVLLLNTDVACTPGWLAPLVALAEQYPRLAAVMPKIRSYRQPTCFEYAGAAGGWLDAWGFPFCRGRIFGTLEPDKGQYDDARPVFWASGACMLIRTSVIRQLGLFDQGFGAHMEEIDFCWRAQNAGYEIWVEPKSLVYHLGGASLPMGHPRKVFYNIRNSLLTYAKNAPLGSAVRMLGFRLCLDGVWGLVQLLRLRPALTWTGIRAHLSFWGRLRSAWRSRRLQPPRRLHQLAGYYPGSLLWQHYVRGKKTFRSLFRSL
ncbi:MAG: glycosyltransferase family 2 protein [Sphingobacteriia bacterium]